MRGTSISIRNSRQQMIDCLIVSLKIMHDCKNWVVSKWSYSTLGVATGWIETS